MGCCRLYTRANLVPFLIPTYIPTSRNWARTRSLLAVGIALSLYLGSADGLQAIWYYRHPPLSPSGINLLEGPRLRFIHHPHRC